MGLKKTIKSKYGVNANYFVVVGENKLNKFNRLDIMLEGYASRECWKNGDDYLWDKAFRIKPIELNDYLSVVEAKAQSVENVKDFQTVAVYKYIKNHKTIENKLDEKGKAIVDEDGKEEKIEVDSIFKDAEDI